jgi:hypothetical protein
MLCRTFSRFVIGGIIATGFFHAQAGQSIPFDKLGVAVSKKSENKGLAITELWNGYHLDCRMQDLQAEVTMSGVIVRSTSESEGAGVFSIRAARMGRGMTMREIPPTVERVTARDGVVRSVRADCIEEYTTSCNGIRQDFVIAGRPGGKGKLLLELAVEEAELTITGGGAGEALKLRLANGRELVYHTLNVTDAAGKRLEATFEKAWSSGVTIEIEDNGSRYPVRVDPTISDADWVSIGGFAPGVNRHVCTMVFDVYGNLYIGGDFDAAGGNRGINYIAKWDGNTWSAPGGGVNGAVYSLALEDSGTIYAGGQFDKAGGVSANNIAKWDGNAWSALGGGTNGDIYSLAAAGSGAVYAGGRFDTAGGVGATRIAKWDGSAWSALGSGMGDDVNALIIDDSGNVYAGGWFTKAGGVAVNNIAKWNGTAWSALGSGMNSVVNSLAFDGLGDLYAAGGFTKAGDIFTNYIAKWNGTSWSALGNGMSGDRSPYVYALAVDDSGNLYAGGYFTYADGVLAWHIAKWDGNSWSALGEINGHIYALAVDGSGSLYAGGDFGTAGGDFGTADETVTNNIAKWDGNSWNPLGKVTNGTIYALAQDDSGNLYAAGYFSRVGGVKANSIAKWDGSAWSALGGETRYAVYALSVDGSGNLFAGGSFSTIGGTAANHIAKWNGSAWSELGSGISGHVLALTMDNAGNLYAGGEFDTAGNIVANGIARWDGSAWSSLGSGMSGISSNAVCALATDSSGSIYAGGKFTAAGGDTGINHIAKWDGDTWSALDSGTDMTSYALAVDGSGNLYVGGKKALKWDGSAWSELGSGTNRYINTLALDDAGNLYAGGSFTTIGEIAANYIAKWDGNTWSTLGSGTNGSISALALDGSGNLYAGGAFTIAGGTLSAYIVQCKFGTAMLHPRGAGNRSLHSIAYDSRSGCIHFHLQSPTDVAYRIFTLAGREIMRGSESLPKGDSSLRIKKSCLSGIARGAYIAQVRAGRESMRFRMTVER